MVVPNDLAKEDPGGRSAPVATGEPGPAAVEFVAPLRRPAPGGGAPRLTTTYPVAPRRGPAPGSESGQAAVEFVALLPMLVAVLAMAWQAVLVGEAAWQARVAARAAARAQAVGADPVRAARAHLPHRLEGDVRVTASADGDVRVSLRIPDAVPGVRFGRVAANSHFAPQAG